MRVHTLSLSSSIASSYSDGWSKCGNIAVQDLCSYSTSVNNAPGGSVESEYYGILRYDETQVKMVFWLTFARFAFDLSLLLVCT